tara:strand:- start:213 stop:575 length:363 start_codon:yes stop_codon:yes gene_type:complete
LTKYILIFIGFIFYAIGMIGYFVPGMPGTIFIIIAAFCFLKSYPKFYNRIITNKNYGFIVKDFIEFQVIPKKIKWIIMSFIWFFSLLSIFCFLANIYYQVMVLILAYIGSGVILNTKDSK